MYDTAQQLMKIGDTLFVLRSLADTSHGPWLQMLTSLVPAIVGGLIASGSMWLTYRTQLAANDLKVKELDIKMDELRREFKHRERESDLSVGRLILPRSLEVLQEIQTRTSDLNRLLNSLPRGVGQINATERDKIIEKYLAQLKDHRDWYDRNSIFVPSLVRRPFIGVLNYAHLDARELFSGDQREFNRDKWDMFIELTNAVQKAIDGFMEKYNPLEWVLEK
jgi:hypothetical protein